MHIVKQIKETAAFSKVFREGAVVLKELIFKFLLWEGVVVLKELRGLSFHLINSLIHVHVLTCT